MANDYFQFRQFKIEQRLCAMKVGTDGTTLGAWAAVPSIDAQSSILPSYVLDIGTGTGLISLMMAQRYPSAHVTGIDIDASAVAQARANAEASPFAQRITILQEDVASHLSPLISCSSPPAPHPLYDAIVCNPPFFTASLRSPDEQRSMARHDDTLTYAQLARHAWRLLGDGGELSVVVPCDQQRRMEAETALMGFFKSRECLLKTSVRKPPKRVLLAYRKHSVAHLERQELIIGSEEYKKLTQDFYLV